MTKNNVTTSGKPEIYVWNITRVFVLDLYNFLLLEHGWTKEAYPHKAVDLYTLPNEKSSYYKEFCRIVTESFKNNL